MNRDVTAHSKALISEAFLKNKKRHNKDIIWPEAGLPPGRQTRPSDRGACPLRMKQRCLYRNHLPSGGGQRIHYGWKNQRAGSGSRYSCQRGKQFRRGLWTKRISGISRIGPDNETLSTDANALCRSPLTLLIVETALSVARLSGLQPFPYRFCFVLRLSVLGFLFLSGIILLSQ